MIPDGWKLVPVEPTTKMIDAACAIGPDTNSGCFDYDDAATVYKAMLAAAPVVDAWQPIETAPKDGTPIDVYSPFHGRCPNMQWEQLSKGNGFFSPVKSGPCCVRDATHWMPLTPPPKEAA